MVNMRQTISPRLFRSYGPERQRQRASSASADQRAGIIKRLLDIGFYNFLIPFVETKRKQSRRWHQLVTHRKAFAALRFSPRQYVWHRGGLFRSVDKNITILVQIESQQGVDNVDLLPLPKV